jgi:hypothetical protein
MFGGNSPKKALLRRGEVLSWLGLTKEELANLISEGIVKPRYFREKARAFFVKDELEKTFLKEPA